MPFKSGKQRRYLWANEPEIARDWTDRYGARGGGIMRVPLWTGGLPDFFQMNPENIAQAKNLSWKDALNLEKDYKYNPKYIGKDKTSWLGHKRQGLKSLAGIFEGGSNVGGATPLTRKLALGAMRGLRAANPIGAAMLGAEGGARLGDWAYKNWEPATKFGDWAGGGIYDAWDAIKNEFSGSAQASIPEDKIKAMRQDLKSVPAHIQRQTDFPTYKRTAEEYNDYLTAQEFANNDAMSKQNEIIKSPSKNFQYYPQSQDLEAQNIRPTFDSSDEEQDYYNQISNKIGKMPTIKDPNMFQRFRNKFYKPATRNVGGYNVAQLNKMNALGGYYSEPAREARRFDKRGINVLNRAAAGKKVGNVNKLLGQYGYEGGAPGSGDISFTGKPQGDPTAGAGYSRSDDSWGASPFRRGGLASLWPR